MQFGSHSGATEPMHVSSMASTSILPGATSLHSCLFPLPLLNFASFVPSSHISHHKKDLTPWFSLEPWVGQVWMRAGRITWIERTRTWWKTCSSPTWQAQAALWSAGTRLGGEAGCVGRCVGLGRYKSGEGCGGVGKFCWWD